MDKKILPKKYFTDFGIDNDWLEILRPVLSSPEMYQLMSRIEATNKLKVVFPHRANWFKAFELTKAKDLKVLILGQDPYHTVVNGKPVAHGLAFSYKKQGPLDAYEPPSLKNILKEVEDDIHDGMCFGECLETDLTRWAKQGVLLLNTALTVERGKAGSHTKYWNPLIKNIIQLISLNNPDLIVLLWGRYAEGFKPFLSSLNRVLISGHPSPLSANKGLWFGNQHFSKVNAWLREMGKDVIKW